MLTQISPPPLFLFFFPLKSTPWKVGAPWYYTQMQLKEDKVVWEHQAPLKSQLRLSHSVLPALLALGLRMAGLVPPHINCESRDRLFPSSVPCLPPHVGLSQKSTLNSEFSKSPFSCPQQLGSPPSTISPAAWKGNYRLGFICKTNWLFPNSAFGTTAIPEIGSWRKDLPSKNTTCCLKVNFLVLKALLFFRRFSFFTNNFHPWVMQVPTRHSLQCSAFQASKRFSKKFLWFFLKTRTSKSSAHSKQPAVQSLRSCSH